MVAIALKSFKLITDGELQDVRAGDVVTIEDPEDAESLFMKEFIGPTDAQTVRNILDGYVREARVVFGELSTETSQSCYMCHGNDYWISIYGATRCLRCHPPASKELVAQYIHGDRGNNE
jgi:hypothetical protein